MVGGQNAQQEWVLRPRKVQMSRFRDWAAKNLKSGDEVVIEATGNTWDIYDIVAPLVTKTLVAHAGKVRQIAEARVKTDKEDVKRLILLLIADIVPDKAGEAFPEVWVPPMHVRELRSLVSFRWRLTKQITMSNIVPMPFGRTDCKVSSRASISIRRKAKSWPTRTNLGGSSKNSLNSPVSRCNWTWGLWKN